MAKIEITKTDLSLVVKCKCGGVVAASMIYGGVSIDEEFTDTIASVYNNGGKVEIVSVREVGITLDGCRCIENESQALRQPLVSVQVCGHEHIESSDGCDECMNCGTRNY